MRLEDKLDVRGELLLSLQSTQYANVKIDTFHNRPTQLRFFTDDIGGDSLVLAIDPALWKQIRNHILPIRTYDDIVET